MNSRNALSNSDIVASVCLFLDLDSIFTAEFVSRVWKISCLELWKAFAYKYRRYRYHGASCKCNKQFVCSYKRNVCCEQVKLILFGGSFGSPYTRATAISVYSDISLKTESVTSSYSPFNMSAENGIGGMACTLDKRGFLIQCGGWEDKEAEIRSSSYRGRICSHGAMAWETIPDFEFPFCYAAATTTDCGDIYITGGADSPYQGASVKDGGFLVSSDDDMFTRPVPLPRMQERRCGHSSVTLFDDKVVVVGGYSGDISYLNSAEMLDCPSGRWIDLPHMLHERSGLACVVGDCGSIYAAGGSPNGTIGHQSFERLDLREGKWQSLPDMHRRRGYTAGCIGNCGRLYVCGGLHNFTFEPTIEYFDPRKGVWIEPEHLMAPDMYLSRAAHCMYFPWNTS